MGFKDEKRAEDIRNIYLEALGREADTGGLENYYNSKHTPEEIRVILEGSIEAEWKKRKEGFGPSISMDFIEPFLAVGPTPFAKDYPTLKDAGFTHLLDVSDGAVDFSGAGFIGYLKKTIPATAVISTGDIKDCIKYINFIEGAVAAGGNAKLYVSCRFGNIKAPALVLLWYVANGMDSDAALTLVSALKPDFKFEEALLGPWHYKAARSVKGA